MRYATPRLALGRPEGYCNTLGAPQGGVTVSGGAGYRRVCSREKWLCFSYTLDQELLLCNEYLATENFLLRHRQRLGGLLKYY
jgi:hypothetical protein